MREIILGTLAVICIITTLALCKASSKGEGLEHPERITLKGDK